MDIPSSTSTSCSWDLDMTMGNQLLLDQLPYEFLQPFDHHLPTQHLPSSSFSDQVENQRTVEDQLHEEAGGEEEEGEGEGERLGAMKEMMYKIAAMQPVDIDPATIKKPKRRNVRISDDPQSIAARHRRERISERIRILQRLVPGGTKMDTASMLDEAIRYVKFLKKQVQELQQNPPAAPHPGLVGRQLLALEWPLRADGPGTSSSSMAPPPHHHHHPHGLGFSSFSSDGSSSHMH